MTAQIYLLKSVSSTGGKYTYLVPRELEGEIKCGQIVDVPFGAGSRTHEAVVYSISPGDDGSESKYKLKEIRRIHADLPILTGRQFRLARQMSGFYLCELGDCVKCMLPPHGDKGRLVNFADLTDISRDVEAVARTEKFRNISHIKILEYIKSAGMPVPVTEIQNALRVASSAFTSLEKRGLITISKDRVRTRTERRISEEYPKQRLTDDQQAAYNIIARELDGGEFSEVLLHGVTGSGKTEIYLQLIEKTINEGKDAIVLVPEISLTPQMEARFRGRFGEQIAILHSRLTDTERNREWKRIQRGEAKVVLGARSAIFAPLNNLKLIILDEEHELTYKSDDMQPRYHAREIACMLGKMNNLTVVYGTATPSIETFYRAKEKEIAYVYLPKRINEKPLPGIKIINMRDELDAGERGVFSRELKNAILQNYENHEQTILFVHRRGFSGRVICTGCGKSMKCSKCNIAMTYHAKINRIVCHYCGNTAHLPEECPVCGSREFEKRSFGTQMVEEELARLLPQAKIVRMDADTTTGREGHAKVIEDFTSGGGDILVGTQMIAKGHDFPNVTLVGVVSADSLLSTGDFRAEEKTFELLTQVAGRAGRGAKAGQVIIQAFDVDDYAIENAGGNDFEKFYATELKVRRALNYPPYTVITVIGFTGEDDKKTFNQAKAAYRKLCELKSKSVQQNDEVEILGVTRAGIPKLNNKYRWRIIVKTKTREQILILLKDNIGASFIDIAPGKMF